MVIQQSHMQPDKLEVKRITSVQWPMNQHVYLTLMVRRGVYGALIANALLGIMGNIMTVSVQLIDPIVPFRIIKSPL